MSDLTLKNLVIYISLWAVNAVVVCLAAALAAGAVWGFGEGAFLEPVRGQVAAALGLIGSALAFWLAANRPRLGREDISALVGEIGAIDARVILADVLHGRESTPAKPYLSDADVERIGDRVYQRIAAQMRQAKAREG